MSLMNIEYWLITILFLLLPLGQLQKLPLGISGVSVYVHDLVLAAMWLWILFSGKVKDIFEGKLSKPFWIFTSIGLTSWLINYFHWGKASFIGLGYLIRWILLSAPFFLSKLQLSPHDRSKIFENEHLFKLLRQSIFLLTLFGWVQYLIFPDLTRMDYFGWDDHFYRLTGTLLDPNFMGILLVIGLSLEFSNFQFSIFKQLKKLFYLITLAFTYSRSSYLAWLILLFGWGINRIFGEPIKGGVKKILRIFVRSLTAYSVYFWLAVSAIIFIFLPRPAGEGGNLGRTASTYARFKNWDQTWQLIRKYPIFGVGFNNYRLAVKEAGFPVENVDTNHAAGGADNSFLFVWATTGVFGLIAFLWLVFSLKPWWLILPIVVHALFNHTLFFPWVLIYIWGLQNKHES
jgi:O-antigen ligase